jgi:hypothetical protein
MLQLVAERDERILAREIVLRARPSGDRVDHSADQLLDGVLALRRSQLPAEVLRDDDVGGLLRPELGNLDVALFEDDLALFVADDGRADLPLHFVERVHTGQGEVARELEPGRGWRPLDAFLGSNLGIGSSAAGHLLTGGSSFAGRASFHVSSA